MTAEQNTKKEAASEKAEAAEPRKSKKKTSKKNEPVERPKKAKKLASALFIHCESKLHLAAEDEDTGIESAGDLQQVVRDPKSKLPCIPPISIQRSLALHFNLDEQSENPSFSPASLFLYPARTVRGIFAWCTSAERLNEYSKAFKDTTCGVSWSIPIDEKTLVGPRNACVDRGHLYLEQFAYQCKVESRVTGVGRWIAQNVFPQNAGHQWWQAKAARDLVVLPEEELKTLIELSAIVEPQTASKANSDQLIEYLPPETVFFSVMNDSLLKKELELSHIMLGSGVSQGNGMCRLRPLRYAKVNPSRKRIAGKSPDGKPRSRKPGAKRPAGKKPGTKAPLVEVKKKVKTTETKKTEKAPAHPEKTKAKEIKTEETSSD